MNDLVMEKEGKTIRYHQLVILVLLLLLGTMNDDLDICCCLRVTRCKCSNTIVERDILVSLVNSNFYFLKYNLY